jgi:hypothetical protein
VTDRSNIVHLDGTLIFQSPEDRAIQRAVADEVERKWKCKICEFGALSSVDWYAQRLERLVGVLELKARKHPREKFPTVFLNVRKWLALQMAAIGLGVPGLFVVRFEDGVFWIKLNAIDPRKMRIAGWSEARARAANDIEPVIEVPVDELRKLGPEEKPAE